MIKFYNYMRVVSILDISDKKNSLKYLVKYNKNIPTDFDTILEEVKENIPYISDYFDKVTLENMIDKLTTYKEREKLDEKYSHRVDKLLNLPIKDYVPEPDQKPLLLELSKLSK